MPLSRDLVITQLATLHMLAGHLDQAEATAAGLKDTAVTRELQRKIAVARGASAGQEGCNRVMTPERSKQVELLEQMYSGLAELTQSRERVQAQITALTQQAAKLDQLVVKARQMGREDLAQEALARRISCQSQVVELASQLDQLTAERAKLTTAAQSLQARIGGAG